MKEQDSTYCKYPLSEIPHLMQIYNARGSKMAHQVLCFHRCFALCVLLWVPHLCAGISLWVGLAVGAVLSEECQLVRRVRSYR